MARRRVDRRRAALLAHGRRRRRQVGAHGGAPAPRLPLQPRRRVALLHRHDNPQQSSPDALLRSLAAMLCARLPGYKEALGEVALELLKATDPKELFVALFTSPLQKLKSPAKPSFIILDALDELPKQGQKPLLSVIAAQLSTLPQWLRLFVTSREEPQIKAALAKFKPKELRADEAKNRADVEVRWGATP